MLPLIEHFIDDYNELKNQLLEHAELSLITSVETNFKKTFLLSCASYHECQIQEALSVFLKENSQDERVSVFASNIGIQRQYHTYFKWTESNVNNFLGLFGDDFKRSVSSEIKEDQDLVKCMRAFLSLGDERNTMVHENFLAYNLEKTFEEIVSLNVLADRFVEFLCSKFISRKIIEDKVT